MLSGEWFVCGWRSNPTSYGMVQSGVEKGDSNEEWPEGRLKVNKMSF